MTVRWDAWAAWGAGSWWRRHAGRRDGPGTAIRRSTNQEATIPRRRLLARLGIVGLAVALGCQDGTSERVALPGPDGRREELLLASAKVALPPPANPATDLPDPTSEGARLITTYCTACHEIPTPQIHSPADWPRVARRMWLRIDGLPAGVDVVRPTSAERVVILRYLIGNALQVSGVPLPAAPGRVDFVSVCSRCHELPDPRSYASDDWSAVVTRMGERMQSMLGTALTADQSSEIVRYLVTVSAVP